MKIEIPNEKKIKDEINSVMSKGLVEGKSFCSYLKIMYRQIGIRYLFHDGLELIFAIFLVSAILFSEIIIRNQNYMGDMTDVYAYLFTVSPILYLLMSISNFVKAKSNKTYEVEMTCKYDIYQISAFRMLVFSVISIVFNILFVSVISNIYEKIDFLKAFIVSIASLFIFSVIFLFAINRIKNRLIKYVIILSWIVFNLSLYISKVDLYIQLLSSISIYTWLIVTVVSIYLYMKNLKTLVIFSRKEGVN